MQTQSEQPASQDLLLIPEQLPKVDPEAAVQYLISQGIEWATRQMDLSLRMMCKPILGICSNKIGSIDRETAIEIIQKIHALSYELEVNTGIQNDWFTE